jgi:hypothetical protein
MPMNAALPASDALTDRDREQLNMLGLFHYIFAGLAAIGLGFLLLHFMLMSSIFSDPAMMRQPNPPPQEMMAIFAGVYFLLGALLVLGAGLNIAAGRFLKKRKHRTYCMVIAGLNCLQIPFGTALGVFTLIVLSRDSVRAGFRK